MIARQAKDGRGAQFRVFQAEACKQFVIAFSCKALQHKSAVQSVGELSELSKSEKRIRKHYKLVCAKVRKFLTL